MTHTKPARLIEAKALLVIAVPLIFSYLSEVLMVVTAKMVVGRLGYHELAAAGISTDLAYQMCIILMGFFSVVGVLVSSALGASRRDDVLPVLAQGLVLACLFGLAATLLAYRLDLVLGLAGQDRALTDMAQPFFRNFAFAIIPIVWFGVLRSFAAAMMRTGFVLAITVATVALNYLLMQGLVHGSFGLPRLGLAGAGLAWSLSMWFKCLSLGGYVLRLVWRQDLHIGWQALGQSARKVMPIIRLGLPVAGIVALESGLFAATALLSGLIGARELAAYQMMMSWVAIPFVISLALAEAAMVRVAYWVGAGDGAAARRAGHLGMAIGVAVPFMLVIIPLGLPDLITRTFLDPADAGYREIAGLVVKLLVIAAVFQVFDGLQAIASHALRGLHDAAMPLLIAGIGYWVIGLGAAYVLSFTFGWGAIGLWWGLALGLIFTGSVLAWRFEVLARRPLPA